MQVACNEYIWVHVNVCAHTLNFGIGLLIKETLLILPIELQSKMFYMSICKMKKKKKTLQRKVLKHYGGNSVRLFLKLDGYGAILQGGKDAK